MRKRVLKYKLVSESKGCYVFGPCTEDGVPTKNYKATGFGALYIDRNLIDDPNVTLNVQIIAEGTQPDG